MKVIYNILDKDYDFDTYNYCYIYGEIVALEGDNKVGTVEFSVDFLDFDIKDDVELDWDMGYPMDPDGEGGMQATVVNYKKVLETRKLSLCDVSDGGDFDKPETLLTISQTAEKLGCTEAELNIIIKSLNEEADRYLVDSLQHFVDQLEYENAYEPDFDPYDWM